MFSTDKTLRSRSRLVSIGTAVALAVLGAATVGSTRGDAGTVRAESVLAIRDWTIHYRTHDGFDRCATVRLPAWYGPSNNPSIPLVISPHGRNGTGRANAEYWGVLPAVGRFAVVNPDGRGRRLAANSFGYRGQIDDLARMPEIVTARLKWLRIDRKRVFVLGSSMGGQETLLLVARHPEVVTGGAVAMDSVTNLARRYRQMPELECDASCLSRYGVPYGIKLQQSLAREVGGTPTAKARLYAERSPLSLAKRIASSGVPLQIWWSTEDRIVTDQATQSGALYRKLSELHGCAVTEFVGSWAHSHEMRSTELLPVALGRLGLLPDDGQALPESVRVSIAPACAGV